MDLHISSRLKKLLPQLTSEEKKQLKANIEEDGQLLDPILWWNDGTKPVVIDGMHRWDVVRGTEIPYRTEEMSFPDYEAAEIWILNHQLGRRNLLDTATIRKLRGEMYNRLKAQHGGDRKSDKSTGQNVRLIGDSAQKVAKKAGVSERTVRRDGKRRDAINSLAKPAQKVAEAATDKEVNALAKLDPGKQTEVARAVRVGQASSVSEAMKQVGATPKPPKKKPPKQFDRPHYFKEWDKQIGPLVRWVDKVARALGESESEGHKDVQDKLNLATEAMQEWMGK